MLEDMLKYQEIDKKLKTINDDIKNSECRKQAVKSKEFLSNVDEKVGKLNDESFNLIANFDEYSKKHDAIKERISEYMGLVDTCEDKAELDYLLKKVNELSNQLKDLQGINDKEKQDIASIGNKYVSIRNKTAAYKEEYVKSKAEFDELKKSKENEINELKKVLSNMEKTLDKGLLEKYNQIKQESFPVFVESNGDVCGYCGMHFSQTGFAKLNSEHLVQCEECHRLVYKK